MSDDTPVQQAQQPTQSANPYLIPGAIVLAGIAIAAALFFGQGGSDKTTAIGGSLEATVLPIDKDDHILGVQDPDVYLIEYSDFQCPFCTRFHTTVQQILEEYEGKVAWVYRHFPLDSIHPEARPAAIASECIAEQAGNDVFWQFTNRLFTDGTTLSSELYQSLAREFDLDVDAFDACVASGKYNARIQRDLENVTDIGGQGTPYTVLLTRDGQSLSFSGALPIDRVRTLVDRALSSVQ